jgi:hypothetical protein
VGDGAPPTTDPNATPAAPQTFQDLIDRQASDQAALAADQAAATSAHAAAELADQKVADDQTALAADGTSIAGAVGASGPFYVVNADDTATFYLGDGNGGFHTTTAKPASTALPAS